MLFSLDFDSMFCSLRACIFVFYRWFHYVLGCLTGVIIDDDDDDDILPVDGRLICVMKTAVCAAVNLVDGQVLTMCETLSGCLHRHRCLWCPISWDTPKPLNVTHNSKKVITTANLTDRASVFTVDRVKNRLVWSAFRIFVYPSCIKAYFALGRHAEHLTVYWIGFTCMWCVYCVNRLLNT